MRRLPHRLGRSGRDLCGGACTRAGAGGRPTHEHLDYYLDEFTFRFNRRRSRSRGKLFFRLVQQAVAIDPAPYESLVRYARMP